MPKSVLSEIHNPAILDGHSEDDVPLPIRQELIHAAMQKQISYYYLCAIYRQGRLDEQRRSRDAGDAQVGAD